MAEVSSSQVIENTPVFKFGLISDVQYADHDDLPNYHKTQMRFYRKALTFLRQAINSWKNEGVNCVFQLGDIIDGLSNKRDGESQKALESVISVLKEFPGQVYHNWGNHEFYNFKKDDLLKSCIFSGALPTCVCPPGKAYYSTKLLDKLKLVTLDPYEFSMLGQQHNSDTYLEAQTFLRSKNPNECLNAPEGLLGENRRFTKFNGGVTQQQLEWLQEQLSEAVQKKENVIITSHIPVFEEAADTLCLVWNFEDVQSVLAKYSECITCYLAGHDHEGGSAMDTSGIMHVTFPGVVECTQEDAYATAHVYSDCIQIIGKGMYSSYNIKLRFPL